MKIDLQPIVQKHVYIPRKEQFMALFPGSPAFRWNQVEESLIGMSYENWEQLSNIPKAMRDELGEQMPWLSFKHVQTLRSKNGDTFKAALQMEAGEFESVLMQNKRGSWTICVSSQIGCGMGCSFCATGKMGFKSNLHSDYIIDQYRYWDYFIKHNKELGGRISNVVFMGMGEPLANYPNVKAAINLLLKYTDLGPTRITVSSVGVIPVLNKLLDDPEWPPVRVAISVHSADTDTRREIVQTSYDQFLEDLKKWGIAYAKKLGNRRHHLTFEYVMLNEVNDSVMHANKLAALVRAIGGTVKVNLIPYNATDSVYECSSEKNFEEFMDTLRNHGVEVTRRKNMGGDINAACGQLVRLREKNDDVEVSSQT